MAARVLAVEGDDAVREGLLGSLVEQGHEVVAVGSIADAEPLLAARAFELVLVSLDSADGMRFLETLQAHRPVTQSLALASAPTVQMAVQAMRFGAANLVAKPDELATIPDLVDDLLRHHA
jgi:DNA-binding NtrC family response regulator